LLLILSIVALSDRNYNFFDTLRSCAVTVLSLTSLLMDAPEVSRVMSRF